MNSFVIARSMANVDSDLSNIRLYTYFSHLIFILLIYGNITSPLLSIPNAQLSFVYCLRRLIVRKTPEFIWLFGKI